VRVVNPAEVPGAVYYFYSTPKSPHGCDVDPTGEYITENFSEFDCTLFNKNVRLPLKNKKILHGVAYGIPGISKF
jgi:nitrous-oxide reductase